MKSIYAWECPNCQNINKSPDTASVVVCKACTERFDVYETDGWIATVDDEKEEAN